MSYYGIAKLDEGGLLPTPMQMEQQARYDSRYDAAEPLQADYYGAPVDSFAYGAYDDDGGGGGFRQQQQQRWEEPTCSAGLLPLPPSQFQQQDYAPPDVPYAAQRQAPQPLFNADSPARRPPMYGRRDDFSGQDMAPAPRSWGHDDSANLVHQRPRPLLGGGGELPYNDGNNGRGPRLGSTYYQDTPVAAAPKNPFARREYGEPPAPAPVPLLRSTGFEPPPEVVDSQRRPADGVDLMTQRFGAPPAGLFAGAKFDERGRFQRPLLDAPPMQSILNRHLFLLADMESVAEAPSVPARVNINHPAYEKRIDEPEMMDFQTTTPTELLAAPSEEKEDREEPIDGPAEFPVCFDSPYALGVFDLAYENSIWDYDPKFTKDYLAGTKRGSKPCRRFVFRLDYVDEEFSWKKWERVVERTWRETYVPKVQQQQALIDAGVNVAEDFDPKAVKETPEEKVTTYFEEKIGFPDNMCTVEYCGLCDVAFNSVLPSITHYTQADGRHERQVHRYFIDNIVEHELIPEDDIGKQWVENIIRRFTKKYKTKPLEWFCSICSVTLSSPGMAQIHFKGTQHQRRAKGLPVIAKLPFNERHSFDDRCVACNVVFEDEQQVRAHVQSKGHMMAQRACAANNVPLPPGPSSRIAYTKQGRHNLKVSGKEMAAAHRSATGANTEPLADSAVYTCSTCNKTLFNETQYEMHMQSVQHMNRESLATLRALKGQLPVGSKRPKAPAPPSRITVQSMGVVPGGAVALASRTAAASVTAASRWQPARESSTHF